MADAVSQIDAACFVLDFAQNNGTVASLREVYGPFLDRLRKAHPETPILAITPIFSTREAAGASQNEGMREHIRQVVSQPHQRRRPEPASGRRNRPAGTLA